MFWGCPLGVIPREHHQKNQYVLNLKNCSTRVIIFDLKVSLDRVYQDLYLSLWGYPPKRVRTRRAKKRLFKFTTNFMIFKRNSIFARHFTEYNYFFSEVHLLKKPLYNWRKAYNPFNGFACSCLKTLLKA